MTHRSTKLRAVILGTSLLIGSVSFLGGLFFLVAGAGLYGSPLHGTPLQNLTLVFVVLFGPIAVLPGVFFEMQKPKWGALFLCTCSLICAIAIVLHNSDGIRLRFPGNVALAISSIVLPLFGLGSVFLRTNSNISARIAMAWVIELLAMILIVYLYVWDLALIELKHFLLHPRRDPFPPPWLSEFLKNPIAVLSSLLILILFALLLRRISSHKRSIDS